MKKGIVIALGMIIISFIGTEVFSQRGRAMRPMSRQQSPPCMMYQAGRPGQGQQMMRRGPAGQRDPLMNCLAIEGLSQEQRETIMELQTARIEESTQHRAKMDELRARKRSAMIMKEADMEKINQTIDEMEALRTTWMKEAIAHREEIRQILTDEQRVIFDRRCANRPMMRGRR